MSSEIPNLEYAKASQKVDQILAEIAEINQKLSQKLAELTKIRSQQMQRQNSTLIKIRLPNGNFMGYSRGIKDASLVDVEESKAQIFKTVLISEGPHEGHVEFEAVGGHQDGKVLDNRTRKNISLGFYERGGENNPAQRWMVKEGKITSAVEGNLCITIKEAGRGRFTYSEQGSLFTFVATDPPDIAPVP